MSDAIFPPPRDAAPEPEPVTLGSSSLFKLFEAFIALRENNTRQHKLFEQSQNKTRDELRDSFNSFAAATQRAYQQLRQEIHGEKKVGLNLMTELLENCLDLHRITQSRPPLDDAEAVARWAESIEVESRKLFAGLERHGIHRYDAVIGTEYNPALHERVGSKPMEGMPPLRVAEQREPGFASQQPGFVLRRPKVIVSE
jgi:molecular chaperone GrpE (heat shock protein)